MEPLQAGLDIGSTTAKLAIIDREEKIVFSDYQRHGAKIFETVEDSIQKALNLLGNCRISLQLTGSAGMGVSEKTGIPFIQEIIATDKVVRRYFVDTATLVDIGGEDSKMIFFNKNKVPDIRMNGNCAGGTGAFIDQMATLLNIPIHELDALARNPSAVYPIASRCGVFAKTDVQNLISRKIPPQDIVASIFHAVAIQCINTLARGFEIKPKIMLCGGPFTFLPELRTVFLKTLQMDHRHLVLPPKPEILPAWGAALSESKQGFQVDLQGLLQVLEKAKEKPLNVNNRLKPLFKNQEAYNSWKRKQANINIKKTPLRNYDGKICFLGIDSGSTTTKIVAMGVNHELLFSWYQNNRGNSIQAVLKGLESFEQKVRLEKPDLEIARTTVTGYGEDLVKAAFSLDKGIVETIAHFTAARHINPDVSFVLDIGGQDMKAIFVNQGVIDRIELNEACSSGCGSFIETFSNSLNYEVTEFAQIACQAEAPCDLGTRCTVFMNSKVKQSLRENASVEEISAGLSYSVIKNCLFKVLKLSNMSELGDQIVIQGGAFRNPSLVRALEQLTGKEIKCSDIPELMGAYGAALIANQDYLENRTRPSSFVGLANLNLVENYNSRQVHCKGCENNCNVTKFKFQNKNSFFSGNKCEKFFVNQGNKIAEGYNFFDYKKKLLFERNVSPNRRPLLTIGIPRCLNFFENFPFWHALFTNCGINLELSSPSTMELYEKGLGTVMSDSICFPAKMVHGHVADLLQKKVDRIFYPRVVYEKNEFPSTLNSFNCPIVSGYPDVIKSSINPEGKYGIPFDSPSITFDDESLLRKSCRQYLKHLGVSRSTINEAVNKALAAQNQYKDSLRNKGAEIIRKSRESNQLLIILAGRPYHTDPLINHKTPEILAGLGSNVISEDAIPLQEINSFKDVQVLTQWSYSNRIFQAALWVSRQAGNIHFVEFNSFGCGPDAIVMDEAREILKAGRKNYTLIKVDEITSTGSVRLRLRSMIESLKLTAGKTNYPDRPRKNTPAFAENDKKRTILAPYFADNYSLLLPAIFEAAGYKVANLPKPDQASVETGLRYSNNEICFPATIVIGDIIKALQSGNYNPAEIAIGITQTGGQCRASSYLSLIKKALISAGFEDIPVISVTTSKGLNDQPGFEIDWLKMTKILFVATMFCDCLAKMYYATGVREKTRGDSQDLQNHYLELAKDAVRTKDSEKLFQLLEQAITKFNQIAIHQGPYPKIGIVGEIYVKYNSFAHNNIINWLTEQGIEVVVPPIIDFFIQDFVNLNVNVQSNLRKAKFSDIYAPLLEQYIKRFHNRTNKIMSPFRFFSPFHDIRKIAGKAGRVLHLANQFGEGWLIAGEIVSFADEGIKNVVSLQPFGCIANQVISKGIETRIRELYPDMNLLFLDFEAGTSEVNILNRLYFMVKNVAEQMSVA